jgi:hypothetical protein
MGKRPSANCADKQAVVGFEVIFKLTCNNHENEKYKLVILFKYLFFEIKLLSVLKVKIHPGSEQ